MMIDKDNEKFKMRPSYRYGLKALITSKGYRTITEFSQKLNVDVSRVSRVVSGWELPSTELSLRMCRELGITMRELQQLCGQF